MPKVDRVLVRLSDSRRVPMGTAKVYLLEAVGDDTLVPDPLEADDARCAEAG